MHTQSSNVSFPIVESHFLFAHNLSEEVSLSKRNCVCASLCAIQTQDSDKREVPSESCGMGPGKRPVDLTSSGS
jgi:hypothetical protein